MLESDEMTTQSDLILDLQTLNQISQTLNQATDVHSALNTSLAQLVDLMGMETGWVFVRDEAPSAPPCGAEPRSGGGNDCGGSRPGPLPPSGRRG